MTGICILYEFGKHNGMSNVKKKNKSDICLSAVTVYEFFYSVGSKLQTLAVTLDLNTRTHTAQQRWENISDFKYCKIGL